MKFRSRDPKIQPELFIRRFRLSDEFKQMDSAHAGLCAICDRPSKKNLAVDHDHLTGQIRGLLCLSCNVRLGHLDDVDWLEKAMSYKQRGTLSTIFLKNFPPSTLEEFRSNMSKTAKRVQNLEHVKLKRNAAVSAASSTSEGRKRRSEAQKKVWKKRKCAGS